VFAFAAVGIPDGIKCNVYGNVYSGCGDGVEVLEPAGTLIGRIMVREELLISALERTRDVPLC